MRSNSSSVSSSSSNISGGDLDDAPDSSFGHGLVYNPLDPYNMYPHHETGEEVYGPPPMFGINKHDPFNMKPFNPNMFSGLLPAPSPLSPVYNTLGPNPFTPLLQPMTPTLPMAPVPGNPTAPPMAAPVVGTNPLLMAAAVSSITGDSSFNTGADPSSASFEAGSDPSSFYYMNPYNPYFLDPFATHIVQPQYAHPTDPNNQYPNPLTGSLTQPGPALAGGYNVYDPQNLIGAPPAFSERERALEHNRAAMQAQSPYAPYRMNPVPVPHD